MKKLHLLLAANILFALALTISCDGGGGGGGGWQTCSELEKTVESCYGKYESEYNKCTNDACEDAVDDKIDQCIVDAACNGTKLEACGAHYEAEGCGSNNGEDIFVNCQFGSYYYYHCGMYPEDECSGNGGHPVSSCGNWLSCYALDDLGGSCYNRYPSNETQYESCLFNGACKNALDWDECEAYYEWQGCLEEEDDDYWNLSCSEADDVYDNCEYWYGDDDDSFENCIRTYLCNGNYDLDACADYYNDKCWWYY